MKKLKVFAVAAALTLTTAGVFAGTSRFFTTPPNLYIEKGTSYVAIATTISSNLQYGVAGTQVTMSGAGGPYNAVTLTSTGYQNVVTTAF